MDDMLVH